MEDINEVAKNALTLINSNKSFKEKYQYGKVPKDTLYIGVKNNTEEAVHSALIPSELSSILNRTLAEFYKNYKF